MANHGVSREEAAAHAAREAKMASAVVDMPVMADAVQCPIVSFSYQTPVLCRALMVWLMVFVTTIVCGVYAWCYLSV